MLNKYPTPLPSYFHSSVKPENRVYVYMGDINEKHYFNDIVNRHPKVKRTGVVSQLSHFKTFDWENPNRRVELKTRTCEHDCFYDTMIGYNKVVDWEWDTSDKRYFFMFGFLDGLYEWELTQENLDAIGNFEKAVRPANTTYKPSVDYSTFNQDKLHLYIPVDKLTNINDKGCLIPDELLHKCKRKWRPKGYLKTK
jgi:hypothetical protein